MQTIYLIGPMTGLPDFNHEAFNSAASRLRNAGYRVVNPTENGLLTDAPWISHMRKDIADMVNACDAVATLPGFEASKGAIIEICLAAGLGFRVHTVQQWIDIAQKSKNRQSFNGEVNPASRTVMRNRIERHLLDNPGSHTVSEIADALAVSTDSVRRHIHGAVTSNVAINTAKSNNDAAYMHYEHWSLIYRCSRRNPIAPSTMENGSTSYWSKFMTAFNTPPRSI